MGRVYGHSEASDRDLLGPLGLAEEVRYLTYRGTEDVVYLVDPQDRRGFGLRPADGDAHRYYRALRAGSGTRGQRRRERDASGRTSRASVSTVQSCQSSQSQP